MSRILVVEPCRVLQRALVVALFPEHQARTVETIPDDPGDADLVLVDAHALRERDALSGADRKRIGDWQRPVVWIDDLNQPAPAEVTQLARLATPLTRDRLKASVAESLKEAERMAAPAEVAADGAAVPSRSASGAATQVIELTEVYDDDPQRRAKHPGQKE